MADLLRRYLIQKRAVHLQTHSIELEHSTDLCSLEQTLLKEGAKENNSLFDALLTLINAL